jgi:hypothetical protein
MIKEWATRGLRAGDLTALAAIGKGAKADSDRIARLVRRGFLAERGDDAFAITVLGRVALAIWRVALP